MLVFFVRAMQIAAAVFFFVALMATRAPRRWRRWDTRDGGEETVTASWKRRYPSFRAHERLARLKLRRVRERFGRLPPPIHKREAA